jgi:hypothetical protein
MEKVSAGLRIIIFTSLFAVPSLGQQPFYTDDAEVSAKGSFRLGPNSPGSMKLQLQTSAVVAMFDAVRKHAISPVAARAQRKRTSGRFDGSTIASLAGNMSGLEPRLTAGTWLRDRFASKACTCAAYRLLRT